MLLKFNALKLIVNVINFYSIEHSSNANIGPQYIKCRKDALTEQ